MMGIGEYDCGFRPRHDNRLDDIHGAILRILDLEVAIMTALSDLQAEVAAETGAVNSAIALISGLAAKIDQLIAAGNVDPALVQLSADIHAETAALAAAVAAHPVPAAAMATTPPAAPADPPATP